MTPCAGGGTRWRGRTGRGRACLAAGQPFRHTQYATGVVGLRPARPAQLLEVVQGRSGGVYGDWLAARPEAWREQIRLAALDPFRGYLNALRAHLPDAAHVLDAFHVTALGMKALDEVRRRVQQDTLGRRGHKGDPLYEIRRVLRRRADRLSESASARLDAAWPLATPTARSPSPGGPRSSCAWPTP